MDSLHSLSKTALVTGVSSCLGQAIAKNLLGTGWEVIGLSLSAPAFNNPRFHHISVDLADSAGLDAFMTDIPSLDAVIHAAGLELSGWHDACNLEDGPLMWQIHVDVPARLLSRLSASMPDGARIVVIGSPLANGIAGKGLFAASRAAQGGLVRSVAAELAPHKITVNIISPGPTERPAPLRAGPPDTRKAAALSAPLIDPEEVAALAGFLLSPGAASVTGQDITVCGGATL